jgi:hypothetical protein
MVLKSMMLLAAGAMMFIVGNAFTASPAEAVLCVYSANNGFNTVVQGIATGVRKKGACRRAKRRCERKLRRAKYGRGTETPKCREIGEAKKGR